MEMNNSLLKLFHDMEINTDYLNLLQDVEMNNYYVKHYINARSAGIFLLISFLGLAAVLLIIFTAAKIQKNRLIKMNGDSLSRKTRTTIRRKPFRFVESFYEMCFSSTSVLLFLALYYIIDARMPQVEGFWHQYQSLILLAFMCVSVFMTNYMDIILVRLVHLNSSDKSAVRLVSCLYIILILMYIRFIYEDTNYDSLIMYFVTLAVSRFIYFDFTAKDFVLTLRSAARFLPLLGLMMIYSGLMCWTGFRSGFLLTSNGVIVSTLIAHCFMDLTIFMVDKTKLLTHVQI